MHHTILSERSRTQPRYWVVVADTGYGTRSVHNPGCTLRTRLEAERFARDAGLARPEVVEVW